MAKEMLHEDFGEKIGGAKKDLWGARGLYSYDLEEMNSREADKYVKKDNIWKKPDYQAMIAAGKPVDLAYFLKVVRDSLNAVPRYYRTDDTPEKRLARQKEYIETIREIQAAIEKVQSVEDALQAFDTCMIRGGYFERKPYGISGVSLVPTKKGSDNPTITDKLVKALYGILRKKSSEKRLKSNLGFPLNKKFREVMKSISMMEKIPIRLTTTGSPTPTMLQEAILSYRRIFLIKHRPCSGYKSLQNSAAATVRKDLSPSSLPK